MEKLFENKKKFRKGLYLSELSSSHCFLQKFINDSFPHVDFYGMLRKLNTWVAIVFFSFNPQRGLL